MLITILFIIVYFIWITWLKLASIDSESALALKLVQTFALAYNSIIANWEGFAN